MPDVQHIVRERGRGRKREEERESEMLLLQEWVLAACSINTCKFIQRSSAWHGQIYAKWGGKFISVPGIFLVIGCSSRCLWNPHYPSSFLQLVPKSQLILFKNPSLSNSPLLANPAPAHWVLLHLLARGLFFQSPPQAPCLQICSQHVRVS